ncbi:MAG: HNH endonuclease [Acidobacteriaceae bacterium]
MDVLAVQSPQIKVEQRHKMDSPWAQLTPYYLNLDSEREILAATPLLLYAASQIKGHSSPNFLLPSEDSASEMVEGTRITVQVSRVERNPEARKKCIQIFGVVCIVCGFDFERTYGEIGSGFIHVHHLNSLAETKGQYKVNPRTDLRPVCPNCHEMLHKNKPPFSIEELKARVSK